MKNEDYILAQTCLANAYDCLYDIVETCDTSKHDSKYETDTEVNDWNKRFNNVIEELVTLKMEMVFTFRIED